MIQQSSICFELQNGEISGVLADFEIEPYQDAITQKSDAVVTLKRIHLGPAILEEEDFSKLLTPLQIDAIEEGFLNEFLQDSSS